MSLLLELFEILSNQTLTEDKKEYIVSHQGEKLIAANKDDHQRLDTAGEIVDALMAMDPTKGKYLQWLVNIYTTKDGNQWQFRLIDSPTILKDLELFTKVQRKIGKGILEFKTMSEFRDALAPYETGAATTQKTDESKLKQMSKQAKFWIKSPHFEVIQPLTKEASIFFGRSQYGCDTKWCTARDDDQNAWDNYTNGELFIIIADNKKFQLYVEHEVPKEFMTANDTAVKPGSESIKYLSKFPQWEEFLNKMIKTHYSKYHED